MTMRRFLIMRKRGGKAPSAAELAAAAEKSNGVLRQMGPGIQWVESFVGTGGVVFCHYLAENEALLRKHAQRGDFPIDRIFEIGAVIDPTTASSCTAAG